MDKRCYMLFKYGKPVTGTHFFDRSKLKQKTYDFIQMNQSFMLKAPRRYGKTSLVKHVLQQSNREYFYGDLQKLPRLAIFNEYLINYAYSRAGISGFVGQVKENVVGFLRTHKTEVKINLETLELSTELFSNDKTTDCERLINALETTNKIAQELDKVFYVVLDEFQEIKRHSCNGSDILEIMRSVIQHHENVCYIFLGSHTTLMTEIFENKKSPFFNFCRKVKLDAFDLDALEPELIDAFKSRGIVFDTIIDLREVLERLNGHPANTMLVMQNIERRAIAMELKLVKKEDIEEAFMDALDEMEDLIDHYISELQSKEHLYDVVYRLANGEDQILEARSLYQKFKMLETMGFVIKIGRGKYKIIDGLLEEALRRVWQGEF